MKPRTVIIQFEAETDAPIAVLKKVASWAKIRLWQQSANDGSINTHHLFPREIKVNVVRRKAAKRR